MEEIEGMDITSLRNEHDLFECNLCSFECGNKDSGREHMIDHLNQSKEDKNTNLADEKKPKKRLIDKYDNDGNYIEDEPHLMDSDSQSEREDNNWQMQEN